MRGARARMPRDVAWSQTPHGVARERARRDDTMRARRLLTLDDINPRLRGARGDGGRDADDDDGDDDDGGDEERDDTNP